MNDSGFPLQIALHRQIDQARDQLGWQVRFSEHSWRDRESGEAGFVDLVLMAGRASRTFWMVIECKRVRDVEWLFLNSTGSIQARRHAKVWASQFRLGEMRCFGWEDVVMDPACPEAHFCAVRGQNNSSDRITLLEKTAGQLIAATEALATELRDFRDSAFTDLKLFFSVIVTTAKLKVASFDPTTISLEDGTLPEAEFSEVPFVRLRKQLSTRMSTFGAADLHRDEDLAGQKEHTVFVVKAEALTSFLEQFGADLNRFNY